MKNMKRRILITAILPLLFGFVVLQSCSNKDAGNFTIYGSFSEPVATAPLNGSKVYATGTTLDLKWTTADPDGDTPNASVYFGTNDKPDLLKSGVNALLLNVTAPAGKTYYWKVMMTDANKVTTTSPVFSFTVLVKFVMANMVGTFDCNEPGYGHYNCNFTSVNATTVRNDNFWDSGYAVDYVFSADGKTITIPPVTVDGYNITGSGAFDENTGQFNVHYIVKKASTGALADDNTHTFTKK